MSALFMVKGVRNLVLSELRREAHENLLYKGADPEVDAANICSLFYLVRYPFG